MKRRAPYAAAGLKTQIKSCALIGGEGKFCAERFGWAETSEGIVSSYAVQSVQPVAAVGSAVYTRHLPSHGYSVIITKFGQIFKWNTTDITAVKSVGAVSTVFPFIVPCVVDGENAYAVYCGAKVGALKKESLVNTAIPYKLFRGAGHCGRVFAVDFNDRYTVRWSGFGITDWTEGLNGGGYIKLSPDGGGVLNIIEYGEKLVFVRENAITVFSGLGDAQNFRATQSESFSLPPVIGDTSVICGGQLWFCTAEGLYCYNGGTPRRAELDLCGDGFTFTRAVPYRGRYIYLDGICNGELRIVEYDTHTGVCVQFGKGCNLPFGTEEGLFCMKGTAISRLVKDGEDAARIWRSKPLDFGVRTAKTLKCVTVEGEGDFSVAVYCDGRKAGVYGAGVHRACVRGVSFTFTVTGAGKVTKLAADWEVSK